MNNDSHSITISTELCKYFPALLNYFLFQSFLVQFSSKVSMFILQYYYFDMKKIKLLCYSRSIVFWTKLSKKVKIIQQLWNQIKYYCTPGLQALVEFYQKKEFSEIENIYLALASVFECTLMQVLQYNVDLGFFRYLK